MKFLIIGSGGTGGCIGGFLASNGNDVTFIARGQHLKKMKEGGLIIKSGLKGDIFLPDIKAFDTNEYNGKADVIFVCVKSYSLDDIIPFLERASHSNTIIIPILNGTGIGNKIFNRFNGAYILDGCVYVSAYVASPGEIVHVGNGLAIVFGARENQKVPAEKLEAVRAALQLCGIKAMISDNIRRDTFKKFSFISPYASCGAYYGITAKGMQQIDEYRSTYIKLIGEIKAVADAIGISFQTDIIEDNIKLVDSLPPDTTASLQKDLMAGKETEMDGIIFEVVRLAEKYGVQVPNYRIVADKFGYTGIK